MRGLPSETAAPDAYPESEGPNLRRLRASLPAILFSPVLLAQITVSLSPQTSQAFDEYVRRAEAQMDWNPHLAVKPGDIQVSAWKPGSPAQGPIQVRNGLIHDWIAGALVPGASIQKALALFQDYPDYKRTFAPEVLDSRLLEHHGEQWRAALTLRRNAGLSSVVFNTEYQIEYRVLDQGRIAIVSRSTKIAEADEDGKDLAPGDSHGFLWRLNSYWLLDPRPQGLYLECRTISLSRDIPSGLGWLVRPFLSNVPRDSLKATLEEVRKGLR